MTQKRACLGGVTSLAIVVGLFATPVAAAPFFQGIGFLADDGLPVSLAFGLSDNGTVVVGEGANAADQGEAFRWTRRGGMQGLGHLSGGRFTGQAHAASPSGQVIVGRSESAAGPEAFRWTRGVGMQGLGDLPGGVFQSFAYGLSDDGRVVVGEGASASGFEAMRWTQGNGMQGLGDLPGGRFESMARDVSANGAVVVGRGSSVLGFEAFRWTESGGMEGLGDLPGRDFRSTAIAVSADGKVIVGSGFGVNGSEAFRWTERTGMQGLGHLGNTPLLRSGWASDVSDDGRVIVGHSDGVPFVWNAQDGMRSIHDLLVEDYGLDLGRWRLSSVTGVSADGQVFAGWGSNPLGQGEGWIASIRTTSDPGLLPEPGTLMLFGLGLFGLGIAVRRAHPLQ